MTGFVRTKMIRGKLRHYLVESYRNDRGQPRQRVLAYLGDHATPHARIAYLRKHLRTWHRQLSNAERLSARDQASTYAYRQVENDRAAKEDREARDKLTRTVRRAEASLKHLEAVCSAYA